MNRFLPVFALALTFASCSSSSDTAGTGTISVVLTDSASDELSQFEVDVSNIVLTKVGGATVSVMPRTTRVDFVELESLNELVTAVDLERGVYTRVTLTLDFANAEVLLVGQTTPATINDANGTPITGTVDVTVDLVPGSRLFVAANRNNLFSLDLDLNQSVAVDSATNSIRFTPVLEVQVDPGNPKPIATTGILNSVDLNALTFAVERRDITNTVIHTFTVAIAPITVFQLDGVLQGGAAGLGSLVGNIGQRVFVQGLFSGGSSRLTALAVESGAGVPGNGQDWVFGHVTARTGGPGVDTTLTVLGRSLDTGTSTRTYNTAHTVNVSHANTKVLRRGAGNTLDSDDINVGQLVWIFGDLTGTTLDATAATGVARLLRTSIFGIATGPAVGDTLTLDVVRFDHRDVAAFNFDVSGQVQADPNAFTVDVTGLTTTGITTDSRIRAFGWIAPVGSTGDDATAFSLVDRTNAGKVLYCLWVPSSLTALSASTNLTLGDIANADIKVIGDGFAPVTLTPSPAPVLQPLLTVGYYRIVQDLQVTAYTDFALFKSALSTRLPSSGVFAVSALGTFEPTGQVFSALTATVVLD
ncbi:MAG TPA: DUF4382 domain-containing protein [Planctomycetota bacterium]|nr:DUF4382 domain-containing protein [Planctomycetota bacterium]